MIFESNIIRIYGNSGKKWIENLPQIVAGIANKFSLSVLTPVSNLSYNYVLSGFQLDHPIILKIGFDIAALKREVFALNAFDGFGAVKVIVDDDGLIILERAISGSSLKTYFPTKDRQAVEVACNVMKWLHKAPVPAMHHFSHIKDWLLVLGKNWDVPAYYLAKARILCDNLLQTLTKDVLLHGDLHHDNILRNGDDWVVIDCKGVIGESAYDIAAFIRNPILELLELNNAPNIMGCRIMHFAKNLEVPPKRILDWCFVQSVLAWIWALEDGCNPEFFKCLTDIFYSMIII